MNSIQSTGYSVHFGDRAYQSLNDFLRETFCSKIFVLVDDNTRRNCLPVFRAKLDAEYRNGSP